VRLAHLADPHLGVRQYHRQTPSGINQREPDVARAFRLAVEMNWHEGVGNHFSAAVSPDGKTFLMNRKWRHFSTIRASDLQLLDAADDSIMKTPEAPDVSAWAIHGGIHASVAHARVLLHLHPPYATAVATLADPEIKPIEQNTARFYNRVAVDLVDRRQERLDRVLPPGFVKFT
jgi:ribulose-5-phosphate 4-epimerase/fuculose-1-phosphate aldolase